MKKFRIASLSEGNKQAKTAAGLKAFVPEKFRPTIKIGDWATTIVESFEKSTELDEKGLPVLDENGNPNLIDKPFDRVEISFIGTYAEVVETMNEDRIYGGQDEAIIAAASEKVAKSFGVAVVAPEDILAD